MPSDFTERKLARTQNPTSTHPPPKITESLPCPRCESTSTKFCYYNNYNLSQPRYFCKACRRYWTHGGTLRNVPVGGGTRKNSKRSRSSSSTSTTSSSSCSAAATTSSSTMSHESVFLPTNPVPMFPGSISETVSVSTGDAKQNECVPRRGSFTSMLNMQGQSVLPFGGLHGYGVGSGFEELELGFGGSRFSGIPGYVAGEGEEAAGVDPASSGCSTWPMVSYNDVGNGGLVDEDCFTWSGLTISTQSKGLK